MSERKAAAFARRVLLGSAPESTVLEAHAVTFGASPDTTINPVQTATYHLKPGNNPITFGARTHIDTSLATTQNAVTGGASAHYSVTNQGLLTGGNYGVQLNGAGGAITNSGTISGGSRDGVAFGGAGGSLSNWQVGVINGAHSGAVFKGGAAKVVNAGRIAGKSGQGVLFTDGGSLTNSAYGSVFGYNGVYAAGAAATITNSGAISGGGAFNDTGAGVLLRAGGVLTNRLGGIVEGYEAAVSIAGSGTVSNSGTLTAHLGKVAAVTIGSGSLTNGKGAVIAGGGTGVRFAAGAGKLSNAGSIGGGTVGTASSGVEMDFGGTVNNLASGVIKGWNKGVTFGPVASTLTNAGTITDDSGVGVSFAASGHLTNTGLIYGGFGIATNGADSTVVNSGSIRGRITMSAGGSVDNQAGGQIAYGGVYSNGGSTFITNAGSMSCNGYAVKIQSGGFTNAATGSVYGGARAVDIAGAGQVTNSGSIFAQAFFGVRLGSGSTLVNQAGGLIKGGVEPGAGDVGDGVGASVGASGSIQNAGSIIGSHYGVYLGVGATLTNLAGGLVAAPTKSPGSSYSIIGAAAGAVTVVNAGAISEEIWLKGGGAITNEAGGSMAYVVRATSVNNESGATVSGQVQATTVVNGGKIIDSDSLGVQLTQGGALSNLAGGAITGGMEGVYAQASGVKVSNAGAIAGGTINASIAVGVLLQMGGAVINQGGGTISAHTAGVEIDGAAGTVTNAGTLSGVDSVHFTGTGANVLTLQTGSILVGAPVGSTAAGATNALILQGAGAASNWFQNFTTLDMQGQAWTLGGTTSVGTAKISAGALTVTGVLHGAFTILAGATLQVGDVWNTGAQVSASGAFTNNGVLRVSGGLADILGAVSGAGSAAIAAGTLEFDSSFTQTVAFTGTSGVLLLAKSQTYAGTISGFSLTGATSLDLRDIVFTSGKTKATFADNGSHTAGVLTVTDGTHTAHISLVGNFSGSTFTAGADGHGGTTIVDPQASAVLGSKPAAVLPFIAAMASLDPGAGHRFETTASGRSPHTLFAAPHPL